MHEAFEKVERLKGNDVEPEIQLTRKRSTALSKDMKAVSEAHPVGQSFKKVIPKRLFHGTQQTSLAPGCVWRGRLWMNGVKKGVSHVVNIS